MYYFTTVINTDFGAFWKTNEMIENHILALQQKHLWKLGVIQPPHYTISCLILSTGI